jgi:hypothetical protein
MDRTAIQSYQPEKITKPFLVIVEGYDDLFFLEGLIKHLISLEPYEWEKLDLVQIIQTSSKDKLKSYLQTIPDEDNILQRIAIIHDADKDQNSAFHKIQGALRSAKFPVPEHQLEPKSGNYNDTQEIIVQILIIGIKGIGMLEDLCLDSVSQDFAMPCVEGYFQCLNKLYDENKLDPPKNFSKAKARVFLASRKEPSEYIGLAAKNGYWDFDKPSFDDIKKLLKLLISN